MKNVGDTISVDKCLKVFSTIICGEMETDGWLISTDFSMFYTCGLGLY